MSSSQFPVAARHPRRGLRGRLAAPAGAVALATASLFTLAGPAHADSVIQITDSADPVPVSTTYTYTVTLPDTGPDNQPYDVTVDLSGAAATFTTGRRLHHRCPHRTAGADRRDDRPHLRPGRRPLHLHLEDRHGVGEHLS